MTSTGCLEQYADLMKNCALGAIPKVEHARRHDVLYLSYRNNYGRVQEDLCQMLIKDIRDALRLGSKLLAADLLIVLGLAVGVERSKMLNPRKIQAA